MHIYRLRRMGTLVLLRQENRQISQRWCDMAVVETSAELKQAHREYMKSRILSAHPLEITAMLYDVAIGALENALRYLKDGNALARANEVSRAQEAVNELMVSLDHSVDASLTGNLASLYVYVQEQILKGHVQQSEDAFRAALAVLKPLWEGWTEIRKAEVQSEAREQRNFEIADAEPIISPSPVAVSERGLGYQQEPDPVSRGWNC